MLFFSSDQGDLSVHTQKIFVTVPQPDGTWLQAKPVAELNWPGASDARPNDRKDGLEIVFDSTGVTGIVSVHPTYLAFCFRRGGGCQRMALTSAPSGELKDRGLSPPRAEGRIR